MEAVIDERDQYKIVTLKNIDSEDFTFSVDNQPYLLKAGELRNFPKFMARLAVKHLVDKILVKQDVEGKKMANKALREEVASKIIVNEEDFAIPAKPTTEEIIEKMNTPSDLDNVLNKQKGRLSVEATIIPNPEPDLEDIETPSLSVVATPLETTTLKESNTTIKESATSLDETFVGLETQGLPTRGEMLSYAEKTLKMNLADKKTIAHFDNLTDVELYKDLGMEQEAA